MENKGGRGELGMTVVDVVEAGRLPIKAGGGGGGESGADDVRGEPNHGSWQSDERSEWDGRR